MKLEQQQKWIDKHKRQYELVCNEFVQKFCDKQEIDFDGWVGNEIGGIALFACQYSFNLSDIILDLTTKQPKGLILEWQNADVDFNMFNENQQFINYKSYTMGLRHEQLMKKSESKDGLTYKKNN